MYWNDGTSLYHHGIPGQKWGVQNGPPYPLDADKHSKREKRGEYQDYFYKKRVDKEKRTKNSSENKNSAVRNKTPKSDYEKYVRSLAVIGGVTVTALAAYGVYKLGRSKIMDTLEKNGDTIVKGSTMQRISFNESGGLHDATYVSKDSVDNAKYAGMLGLTRKMQSMMAGEGVDVYRTVITATDDLKVASKATCEEVFKELMKSDSDFKDTVNSVVDGNVLFMMNPKYAGASLYDKFNASLVEHGDYIDSEWKKYYDALKARGYSAMLDSNDTRFSGYNAVAPLIVFDPNSIAVTKVEKLGAGKLVGGLLTHEAYENGALYIAGLGLVSAKVAKKQYNKKIEEQKSKNGKKK